MVQGKLRTCPHWQRCPHGPTLPLLLPLPLPLPLSAKPRRQQKPLPLPLRLVLVLPLRLVLVLPLRLVLSSRPLPPRPRRMTRWPSTLTR